MKKTVATISALIFLAVGLCLTASAAPNKTFENFESYGGKGAAMSRKWKVIETGDPVTMQLVAGDAGGYKAKLSWSKTPGGLGWGGVTYSVNADWSAYTALRLTFSGLADTNHGVVVQFGCLQANGTTNVPFNYEVHVTNDGRGDWPLLKDGTLTLNFSDFKAPSWVEGPSVKDMKNVTTMTLSVLTDRGKSFNVDDIILVGADGDVSSAASTAPKASSAVGPASAVSTASTASAQQSSVAASTASETESAAAVSEDTQSNLPEESGSESSVTAGGGESQGPSAGLIAGIAAGVAVLAAAGILLYLFVFKKKVV